MSGEAQANDDEIILFEDRIVERLQSRMGGAKISASPDDPSEFQIVGPEGAGLVRYNGGDYERPRPTGNTEQRRKLEFQIFVGSKNRRRATNKAHHGALQLLSLARSALTGFALEDGVDYPLTLFATKDRFWGEINGVWWYVLMVSGADFHDSSKP